MEQPQVSPEPQAQTSTSQVEIDQEQERIFKLAEDMSVKNEGQMIDLYLRTNTSANFSRIIFGLKSKESGEDRIRVVDFMSFKATPPRLPTPHEMLLFSRVSQIHPEVDLNLSSRIRATIMKEIATQADQLDTLRQILEEISEPKP